MLHMIFEIHLFLFIKLCLFARGVYRVNYACPGELPNLPPVLGGSHSVAPPSPTRVPCVPAN